MEGEARDSFRNEYSSAVHEVGVVIHPSQMWLCCSPDGLIPSGDSICLLEIKCPFSRQNAVIIDQETEKCFVPYLEYVSGKLSLKKRHTYYTQVQVQMYILNVKECMFYIYSRVQSACVNVRRSDEFLSEVIPKLESFYFSYLVQRLCE